MTAAKTNERPGTRAEAKFLRVSAYKAREVLDLIRDLDVRTADEVLQFSERDVAIPIRKLLRSAVANAEHNDEQIVDDLFVSACYADEGKTIRRMRPRARGRATRIRKRTCNITIIVSRLPEDRLARRRAKEESRPGSRAARRAGQEAAEARSGRTRRGRNRGAASATEVAEATQAEGIVDQQAAALAAAEGTDAPAQPEVGTAEAEGIVDQTEAAVDQAEAAEVTGTTEVADDEPTATEVAEAEDEAGIVDPQAVEAALIEQDDAQDADGEKS
jgi:large subunit ribosomal protein L22